MSDTPRTDAEIELWSGQDVAFDRMCDFSTKLELELAAERQKVAELERDARRYRWLRNKATRTQMGNKKHAGEIQVIQWEDRTVAGVLWSDALDEAIDRADRGADGGEK